MATVLLRTAAAGAAAAIFALSTSADAFTFSPSTNVHSSVTQLSATELFPDDSVTPSRRSFLSSAATALSYAAFLSVPPPPTAFATDLPPLESSLYLILRAREATAQETRLIQSGKFKDVQRANVKLAVKFIVNNYRLSDNFIAAAGTLPGNARIRAGDAGQAVVQNLYTILEYFDTSDVENIKVGAVGLGGKEAIVLSGLDSARKGMDDYLSYFPSDVVGKVMAQIEEENKLNEREFDASLGVILNPAPKL